MTLNSQSCLQVFVYILTIVLLFLCGFFVNKLLSLQFFYSNQSIDCLTFRMAANSHFNNDIIFSLTLPMILGFLVLIS